MAHIRAVRLPSSLLDIHVVLRVTDAIGNPCYQVFSLYVLHVVLVRPAKFNTGTRNLLPWETESVVYEIKRDLRLNHRAAHLLIDEEKSAK